MSKLTDTKELDHACKAISKSQLFDKKHYLSQLKESTLTNKSDLIRHYVEEGAALGLDPSKSFSTKYYLENNKDVRESGLNPLQHYIMFGYSETRRPKPDISQEDYIPFKHIKCLDVFLLRLVRHYHSKGYSLFNLFQFFVRDGVRKSIVNLKNITVGRKFYFNQSIEDYPIYDYQQPILNKNIKKEIRAFRKTPLISVIMPVYNVDPIWLDKAIKSVKKQWYKNWELCIVDDCSDNPMLIKYLKKINHKRIKIAFNKNNSHISITSNNALKLTDGEYIALMDHDDEITPDAFYEVVKRINEKDSDFIYSDEDKIDLKGHCSEPHYKPIYSPDLFHSQNYISHLAVIRKTLIDKVSGFTPGLEGSQDYDLYLKIMELNPKIDHIAKVLYHWRKIPGSTAVEQSSKSYAHENGKKALVNSLKRRDIKATVEDGKYPGTYNVKYEIIGNPLVSIIIPFKDKADILETCLKSIEKSTYQNYEVICIDNNSTDREIDEVKRKFTSDRVKFYEYKDKFNYSRINNEAVDKYAKGEHIIFLNNDTEVITEDWIVSMLQHSQKDDVGAVGALLLYPNNTIQHAGVILGLGGVANHSHLGLPIDRDGYFGRPWITQNVSAVTAACMMCKKSIFLSVQGLDDEYLPISFNDIDLCLKLLDLKLRNVYSSEVTIMHYESLSRGRNLGLTKESLQAQLEDKVMKDRYSQYIFNKDPYFPTELKTIIKSKFFSPNFYLHVEDS